MSRPVVVYETFAYDRQQEQVSIGTHFVDCLREKCMAWVNEQCKIITPVFFTNYTMPESLQTENDVREVKNEKN